MLKLIPIFSVAVTATLVFIAVWTNRLTLPVHHDGEKAQLLSRCWQTLTCCVAASLVVGLAANLLSGNLNSTPLNYAKHALTHLHTGTDSWQPMLDALHELREHPGKSVYQSIFFERGTKFQYPVSSLFLLDIPQSVLGLTDAQTIFFAQVLSRIAALALVLLTALLLIGAVDATTGAFSKQTKLTFSFWIVFASTVFASALFFYPVVRSEFLGQLQTLISLGAAAALLAWQRGRVSIAGLLVGICCALKPQWAVLVPWAILRYQWRFAIYAIICAGSLLALASLRYGVNNIFDYINVVAYIGQHGESFYSNQSINGLMNRLLFNGNNVEWLENSFPPFHPLVYGATVATSLLLIGFCLFWRREENPRTVDFAFAILLITVASPVAWEHHYAVLLPIFAVALPELLAVRPFENWTIPLFGAAYLLTSVNLWDLTNLTASSYWNVLQSSLLFGALIVLTMLYRLISSRDSEPTIIERT